MSEYDESEFDEFDEFEKHGEKRPYPSFDEENDEELYNLLTNKFNESKIKNCIDFKDPDNNEKMRKFLENGRKNDELEEGIDGYKILLKGVAGMKLHGEVIAFYIPKHLNIVHSEKYKIVLTKEKNISDLLESTKPELEDLLESAKTELEDLLEKSKEGSYEKTFKDKYKRIVLIKPFVPDYIFCIGFEKFEIFYYETIIRNVVFIMNNIYFPLQVDMSYQKNLIKDLSEEGHPTFWYNYINEYVKLPFETDRASYVRLLPRLEKKDKFDSFEFKYNDDEDDEDDENYDETKDISSAILPELINFMNYHNILIMSMYMKNNEDFDKNKQYKYDLDLFTKCGKTDAIVEALIRKKVSEIGNKNQNDDLIREIYSESEDY